MTTATHVHSLGRLLGGAHMHSLGAFAVHHAALLVLLGIALVTALAALAVSGGAPAALAALVGDGNRG